MTSPGPCIRLQWAHGEPTVLCFNCRLTLPVRFAACADAVVWPVRLAAAVATAVPWRVGTHFRLMQRSQPVQISTYNMVRLADIILSDCAQREEGHSQRWGRVTLTCDIAADRSWRAAMTVAQHRLIEGPAKPRPMACNLEGVPASVS